MVRWLVASEVRCAEKAAEIFRSSFCVHFSPCFCLNFSPSALKPPHRPPEEESFPPPLAHAHARTTRSRDEKIKINGTRTTGVRKTFILYILYIQRDTCEREFTHDETEETRALRVKLLSVRFRLRVHTIDSKTFSHETF